MNPMNPINSMPHALCVIFENAGPLPELNPNNPKYRLAIRTWQKLPVTLTKLIGPIIVKNLP
jgi:hypothetical protein